MSTRQGVTISRYALAVVALAATGCQASAQSVSSVPSAISAAPTTTATPGVPQISQGPLVPTRQQWDAARSGLNPRRLVITFGTGDCDGAARATATDRGQTVAVSLVVDRLSAGACDAALRLRHLTVALPTNLAGRPVVDALDRRVHQVFNGGRLVAPKVLPSGFSIVAELPADVLQTEAKHVVSKPRYWARIWAKPAAHGARSDCGAGSPPQLEIYQGTGGFPRYEPSQLSRVGTVRVQGLQVPIQRVKQGGGFLVGWKDPVTGQQVQFQSETCIKQKPYSLAAFTRIAQSIR